MKGIELAERFFHEIIEPMLDNHYPKLQYAAALLGAGSEVMGYDDEISKDHDWGLRLNLFLKDDQLSEEIDQFFRNQLPRNFLGFSTHWGEADEKGVQLVEESLDSEINHRIHITTVQKFLNEKINLKITKIVDLSELSLTQWLSFPEQILLEFVSGKVFKDNFDELSNAREYLAYYPKAIWLFAILGEWNHIAEDQVFMSRAGSMDNEIGSRLIATSMINRIIRLALHLERRYIPYTKWTVTSFKETSIYDVLSPILTKILDSKNWRDREKMLNQAFSALIENHIEKGLIKRYDYGPIQFHTRGYNIINLEPLMTELTSLLPPELKNMTHKIGTINQIINYTNITSDRDFQKAATEFYNSLLSI